MQVLATRRLRAEEFPMRAGNARERAECALTTHFRAHRGKLLCIICAKWHFLRADVVGGTLVPASRYLRSSRGQAAVIAQCHARVPDPGARRPARSIPAARRAASTFYEIAKEQCGVGL